MHAVKTFQYHSHQFRSITLDNEPWFVAKDVCDVLGIENVTMAMSKIPDHHKGVNSIETLGGVQQVNIIDEPGLYRLILRSNKPEAEPFIEWVTAEVLPAIRKTGSYSMADGQADKTVDIRHWRNPVPPSGLDIRYTLDLTKIILQPRRTSLNLLTRIMGIDFSDILPEVTNTMDDESASLRLFVRLCCKPVADDMRTRLKDLHAAYLQWATEAGYGQAHMASGKKLSSWLSDKGYIKRQVGGVTWFYGIELVYAEVVK